jgi:hypothetical protein
MKLSALALLLIMILGSGCGSLSAHRRALSVSEELSITQNDIVDRKARKYGVNPNVLRAILIVEQQRSEDRSLAQVEVCEWAMENSARIVAHLGTNFGTPYTVFLSYATGRPVYAGNGDSTAEQFARRANRVFNQLEKEAECHTQP